MSEAHPLVSVREGSSEDPEALMRVAVSAYNAHRSRTNVSALCSAVETARRAVQVTPDNSPDLVRYLYNLSFLLGELCEFTSDPPLLRDAVEYARRAVHLVPKDNPYLPKCLVNLASRLAAMYDQTGDPELLQEAVGLARGAVHLSPKDSPDLPGRLGSLGVHLSSIYARTGDPTMLEEAIEHTRRAVRLVPENSPNLPRLLNALGAHLSTLYERSGDPALLNEAVEHTRHAVRLTPEDSPDLPDYLHNLGIRLSTLYGRAGDPAVLQEAVDHARRAVHLSPEDAPQLPTCLNSLANRLAEIYTRTGHRARLREAVEHARRAIHLTPEDSPQLPTFLNNLGRLLRNLYAQAGDPALLREAVDHARRAVHLSPEKSPRLPVYLNNLGTCLADMYAGAGDPVLLEEAVERTRCAAGLMPQDSPDLPGCLQDLGNRLADMYFRAGNPAALHEAVEHARRAVHLTPEDSPALAGRLNDLGILLDELHLLTSDAELLREAVQHAYHAVNLETEDSPKLSTDLNNLGLHLSILYDRVGDAALLREAIDHARRAVRLTPVDSAELPARLINLGRHLSSLYARDSDLTLLQEAVDHARHAVRLLAPSRWEAQRAWPVLLTPARTTLASLLLSRDQGGDLAEAAEQLRAALDQQESELGQVRGDRDVQGYLDRRLGLYPLAVDCFLRLAEYHQRAGRPDKATNWQHAAWRAMEQAKGRVFSALLTSEGADFADSVGQQARLEHINRLRGELARLDNLVRRAANGEESAGVLQHQTAMSGEQGCQLSEMSGESLESQRERVRGDLVGELEELARTDPELAGLTAGHTLPLAEIQRALGGTALLALYPLNDRLALFHLSGTGLRIATAPVARAQLRAWTAELDAGSAERWDPVAVHGILEELGVALAAPLADLLGTASPVAAAADAPMLFLTPAGDLHRWPLHLLPWRGGVLWDAFALAYLPTADTLCHCSARIPTTGRPRLLAPDPSLPGSFAEAALAAALGWECLVGAEATVDALCRAAPEVAVASHFLTARHPSHASLMLAGPGGTVPSPTHEIFVRRRGQAPSEHWSVGSCSAHKVVGDDLQGLTRALLRGTRSLQSTLWPLDDLCGLYLGARFRELCSELPGRSKAGCLRQAALELRDGGWAGLATWLEGHAGELEEGRPLLLALAAVTRQRDGDWEGCTILWESARDVRCGRYQAALDELRPDLDGTAAKAALLGGRRAAAEPLTLLHWGPAILVGVPWTATASAR